MKPCFPGYVTIQSTLDFRFATYTRVRFINGNVDFSETVARPLWLIYSVAYIRENVVCYI